MSKRLSPEDGPRKTLAILRVVLASVRARCGEFVKTFFYDDVYIIYYYALDPSTYPHS